jgi:hypothetical protein
LWSVSCHLLPDIVITLEHGDRHDWMVLDAKYRKGHQNVLDGMRSAHLYRDALRMWGRPPSVSMLLIPAPVEEAPWIMQDSFRQAHGVGAIVLGPEQREMGVVEAFVERFFVNVAS